MIEGGRREEKRMDDAEILCQRRGDDRGGKEGGKENG